MTPTTTRGDAEAEPLPPPPLPRLQADVPGAPRTETVAYFATGTAFGSPQAKPLARPRELNSDDAGR